MSPRVRVKTLTLRLPPQPQPSPRLLPDRDVKQLLVGLRDFGGFRSGTLQNPHSRPPALSNESPTPPTPPLQHITHSSLTHPLPESSPHIHSIQPLNSLIGTPAPSLDSPPVALSPLPSRTKGGGGRGGEGNARRPRPAPDHGGGMVFHAVNPKDTSRREL